MRYIGLSEANASDIRKAHAVHPITAVQLEWSLYTRDAEVGLLLLPKRRPVARLARPASYLQPEAYLLPALRQRLLDCQCSGLQRQACDA